MTNDIDRAVAAAEEAFAVFRSWPAGQRARLLRTIAAEIEADAGDIQQCAHRETGLPLARLQGETARTCNQLRLFADVVEEGSWQDARVDHGDPTSTPPKPDVRSLRAPLGPVAVFGAGNFPLAFSVAGGDTASALACGCSVIVKAHPGHLGTSTLVADCIRKAIAVCDAPAGVFSMIVAKDHAQGLALVSHPGVRAVGFTGSHQAGHAIMAAARSRPVPIPVYAEMGSVNPVVVLPGALTTRAEAIAEGLHASIAMGVGQFCTKPGVIFLPAGESARELEAALAERVTTTAAGTMLGPDICKNYGSGRAHLAGTPEVRTIAAVDAPSGMAVFGCGAATFRQHAHLQDEVFGPAALLVTYEDEADLQSALAVLGGQLTVSVHASDDDGGRFRALMGTLEGLAGRLICNGFPTGVAVSPAMHHGGPYPATSDGRSTSVGTRAIERFTSILCFQDWPPNLLPEALLDDNPMKIMRLVDGAYTLS